MNSSSTDNMFSNLTSSPLSAQSWIVDNISSLIASTHDDDFDCTLTNRDEDGQQQHATISNKQLNSSPSVKEAGLHLNDEIEKSRGYEYSPVGGMYAGNTNSCAVNTSIVVNQHYSPPDHLVQQDFLNAYNQIFQQQPQQRNLSFMQYSAKNLNYLDTIQQQQQHQQQQNDQKKNMRHCLSSSDTSRYMDASIDSSLRMPTSSSSSYSLNNYYCDDSYDMSNGAAASTTSREDLAFPNNQYMEQQFAANQQRPLKHSYNHLHPSMSTSCINNYKNNAPPFYEDSNVSNKKKKLSNYSISASSIGPYYQQQQQQQQQQQSFNTSNLLSVSGSSLGFSPSYSSVNSSFYGQNYPILANNQKQNNFHQSKSLIKSYSGTQILSNNYEKLNPAANPSVSLSSLNKMFQNRINDYALMGGDTGKKIHFNKLIANQINSFVLK